MAKVAVVIPVYNEPERLVGAIESIVKFNEISVKFYISDDCSIDDTVCNVEAYLDANDVDYELFLNKKKTSAGSCRNVAFASVEEAYTLFFDADDFVYPGMLDRAIAKIEKLDAELLVMCYERVFDQGDKKLGMIREDEKIFQRLLMADQDLLVCKRNGYILNLVNYPWNKIVRTSYAKSISLRFSDTPVHNDVFAHWLLLMNAQKIGVMGESFCGHRFSPGASQITNVSDERRIAMLDVFSEMEEYFSENAVLKDLYYHLYVNFKIKLFKWGLGRLDEEHKDEFTKMFRDSFSSMTKRDYVVLSEKMPRTGNDALRYRLGLQ